MIMLDTFFNISTEAGRLSLLVLDPVFILLISEVESSLEE